MKLGPLVTNIKRGSVGKRDLEEHRLGNGLIRINECFQVKSRRQESVKWNIHKKSNTVAVSCNAN